MRKYFLWIAATGLICFSSCQREADWTPLFNGENLENWDMHLGTPLRGFEGLASAATPEQVFSVTDENGEKLIRISGEVNGSLATVDTFSNYHLQLVFRWGQEVYSGRNSGLLYHSFGDFGEALGTWMVNLECQFMHSRLGDTYLMNNTTCETTIREVDGTFTFDREGEAKMFGKDFNGQSVLKAVDAENPLGEWNTIDLYCVGNTAVHVVNGQTVMVNQHTGKMENGTVIPLTGGKIQLQSEGGELFIKTIQMRPLKEIPSEILQ